jgi:transcriptional regulator with XRE-family HTH domain
MEQHTLAEIESLVGDNLRYLRLTKNIDQKTLAERAGVSTRALQNLEAGSGSTLKTLISVVRALDREEWFSRIAPVATINPMTMLRGKEQRQRASSPTREDQS